MSCEDCECEMIKQQNQELQEKLAVAERALELACHRYAMAFTHKTAQDEKDCEQSFFEFVKKRATEELEDEKGEK